MLATALMRSSFTAEDWKAGNPEKYAKIIGQFNDSYIAPYSIHNIAVLGVELGKAVGQWFGPSTIATALRQLVNNNPLASLKVYKCEHALILPSQVKALASSPSGSEQPSPSNIWRQGVMIIVPTRLGVSGVNPVYYKSIQLYMRIRQSIGFVGGKPNASYYFVGYQEHTLYYLDPHLTQPSIFITPDSPDCDLQTFFYGYSPCHMPFSHLDESLAFGFYCKDEEDFIDFVRQIQYLETLAGFQSLFTLEETSLQSSGIAFNTAGGEDFSMYASLSICWEDKGNITEEEEAEWISTYGDARTMAYLEEVGANNNGGIDLGMSFTDLLTSTLEYQVNLEQQRQAEEVRALREQKPHQEEEDKEERGGGTRRVALNEVGDDFNMEDSMFVVI